MCQMVMTMVHHCIACLQFATRIREFSTMHYKIFSYSVSTATAHFQKGTGTALSIPQTIQTLHVKCLIITSNCHSIWISPFWTCSPKVNYQRSWPPKHGMTPFSSCKDIWKQLNVDTKRIRKNVHEQWQLTSKANGFKKKQKSLIGRFPSSYLKK